MKNWARFWLAGLIWGSSFLLIKIAVAPAGVDPNSAGLFDPLSLATARLMMAAIGFMALIAVTHRKLPTDRRTLVALVIVGIFNNAIPYALITWGERTVDSGLASVLNATVPLFSLVIAHFALADDKMSMGKILGLISGFAGIVLLATRSIDPMHPNSVEGQLAIVVAAASYAIAAVMIRAWLRHVETMTTAGVSIFAGALILLIITLATVRPLPVFTNMQPGTVLAAVELGIVNTFIAYILFFGLMADWGASRTTMVTYVPPPVGVLLGLIFAHEPIDWKLIVGATMIVGGVALANLWRKPPKPVVESDARVAEAGVPAR